MSFPTRFGTSPALPRDYALVLSSSYASVDCAIEEDEAEYSQDNTDTRSDGRASSSRHLDDDGGSDINVSHHDDDNLSHLSIGNDTESNSRNGITPKARRGAASSRPRHSIASSTTSPTRHASDAQPALGSSLYSRAGRIYAPNASQLESQASPDQGRSQDLGRLSTSLLLGGAPLVPPPGADLRDEQQAIAEGDGDAWEDNDPTPMPGRRTDWLSRPPLTRQQLEQQQKHLREADERTALLSGEASAHNKHTLHPSAQSDRQSIAGASMIAASVHGGPLAPAASAWSNIGALAQPHAPGPAQIQEIEHESNEHIRAREYLILTKYSAPVWGTHLLELSLNVVSVFSIGHLGTIELAAASLASMTANVTAFSLLSGYISALDSLLPPAFTQQPKRVGVYTQSMAIIVFMLLFPIAAVWLNAERLLLALGQNPEVARLSGLYLKVMLPGVPAYAGFEVCRRYLQAQGLMSASTVVLFVVSPLNAFLNWLLVWGPDSVRLGFIGAPIASAASSWLMFILCVGQCYIAPRTAWAGLSFSSATKPSNFMPCLSLGFFGFLAISSEWWAWEISSLVTSLLGTTPLAAQSVLLTCSSIFYQQPFAISVAVAVRVGNLLGAFKTRDAQISSNASLVLSLISGSINSSLIVIFRHTIASLFTEDPEVVQLLTKCLPLLALFQVADGIAGVSGGILRGTGRQAAGAMLNCFSYYIIALPFGTWLTFRSFSGTGIGLEGMWVGLTVALTISAIGGLWLTTRTDWDVEVAKVQARMVDEGGATSTIHPSSTAAPVGASGIHTYSQTQTGTVGTISGQSPTLVARRRQSNATATTSAAAAANSKSPDMARSTKPSTSATNH